MNKLTRIGFMCLIFLFSAVFITSCGPTRIKLYPDAEDPLLEVTLQGNDYEKIAVIPITGFISSMPQDSFMHSKPGTVQEFKAQLTLAEKDQDVCAVILKINSPGGTATASDIMYNELIQFKKRCGKKVIAIMMDVAASGGYYVALPADIIIAHPTTITGSVGVVMFNLQLKELMKKIGVDMQVSKSGDNKDMGSPFRKPSHRETELLHDMTKQLGDQFLSLVKKHRHPDTRQFKEISSARIFSAIDAKDMNLVDQIGYISDAIKAAKIIARLPQNPRVIMYRRVTYPNDNLYNNLSTQISQKNLSLINVELPGHLANLDDGFYYLWTPGLK
jgi:protease-4